MFELLGLVALVAVGAVLFGALALIVGLLKVVFKVALIPVWIGLAALKGIVLLVAGVLALVLVGPVVLGVGLVLLVPLLLLGGLVWLGKTVATTI
jgi:hypothetical protein